MEFWPGWATRGYFGPLPFFLACYGIWRFIRWFIETRRAALPWKALRLWIPTGTLICGSIATGVERLDPIPHAAVVNPIVVAFYELNLPGTLGAALSIQAFQFIHDMDRASVWTRLLVGSLGWWLAWYGVVWFLEWRSSAYERVALQIALRDS